MPNQEIEVEINKCIALSINHKQEAFNSNNIQDALHQSKSYHSPRLNKTLLHLLNNTALMAISIFNTRNKSSFPLTLQQTRAKVHQTAIEMLNSPSNSKELQTPTQAEASHMPMSFQTADSLESFKSLEDWDESPRRMSLLEEECSPRDI